MTKFSNSLLVFFLLVSVLLLTYYQEVEAFIPLPANVGFKRQGFRAIEVTFLSQANI